MYSEEKSAVLKLVTLLKGIGFYITSFLEKLNPVEKVGKLFPNRYTCVGCLG